MSAAADSRPLRVRRGPSAGATSGWRTWRVISLACLVAGLALWLVGLPEIDPSALPDIGLVALLPWTIWASIVLLAAGFAVTLGERGGGLFAALNLAGLVLVLHGTPAIAYETLRYSWAWKHIGIIDFIQRNGSVDPTVPFLAAYHNWPGFFVAGAAIADLFELDSLEIADLARFAPTVLNLCFLLALAVVFKRLTLDTRHVWTAVMIFLTGNWVGQDYFSPQGTTFLLYLIVVALALGPLQPALVPAGPKVTATPGKRGKAVATAGPARLMTNRGVERPAPSAGWEHPALARLRALVSRGMPDQSNRFGRWHRIAAAILLMACVLAIVASHQLTPLVLMAALVGLAVVTRLSPGYALFAFLANALWVLYFAAPFTAALLPGELAGFGRFFTHATSDLTDTGTISEGQVWVVLVGRILSASIAVAGLVGGLLRLRSGLRDGPAVVLLLSPLPLLVATSYGGEVIFRVYLFALPFLAYFAAAVFFPDPLRGRTMATRLAVGVVTVVLAAGFVVANNGKDRQYRFSHEEIAASDWLYRNAGPGTLLVEGARNYPSQFVNYENFAYLPISNESPDAREELAADPVDTLARWLADPRWTDGYVIFTRSQKAYVDAQGVMPAGTLDRMEEALLASPLFRLAYANRDARIFALAPAARPAADPAVPPLSTP